MKRPYEVFLPYSYSFASVVSHCLYDYIFCMLPIFNFVNYVFYFYVYVFLFLCMFRSGYSVSLCCSMYCLFVNVYCTTATGSQSYCSQQIYHIIPKTRTKSVVRGLFFIT